MLGGVDDGCPSRSEILGATRRLQIYDRTVEGGFTVFLLLFSCLELGPGIALHVLEDRALPIKLGMLLQEFVGDEVFAAGMSRPRVQRHACRHRAIGSLRGYRTCGSIR